MQQSLEAAIQFCLTIKGLFNLALRQAMAWRIKMLDEGEWKTKKHGADYRRQWRKVRLGIDAATLEIRAIEVTDNATGDAPLLPCLLNQIPADEIVASVSGDGAYDTKGRHEAIAKRGAQAIVPTRKNANPRKDQRPGATVRNAILAATRRLGRKSGRSGVPITGAALSRPRCDASSCLVNASWRVTLTARSQNCRSVPPPSIGLPGWAHPRL